MAARPICFTPATRLLVLLLTGALTTIATAQTTTVYKCSGSGTTVYSQQPCAAPHTHMQKLELAPDHAPQPDDVARAAAAEAAVTQHLRDKDAAQALAACIEGKVGGANRAAQQRIDANQQQIASLRAHATGGAGANVSGMIASLQRHVDQAQDAIRQRLAGAREQCARQALGDQIPQAQ